MLWAPLIALLAAMASDSEEKPKIQKGDPLEKTIFELIEEAHFKIHPLMIAPLAEQISSGRISSFESAMQTLHRQGFDEGSLNQIGALVYGLAKADHTRPSGPSSPMPISPWPIPTLPGSCSESGSLGSRTPRCSSSCQRKSPFRPPSSCAQSSCARSW